MKLVNKTMEVDESTLQPQLVVTVSLPLETEFDEANSEENPGKEFVELLKSNNGD